MINLLPNDIRQDIKAARMNVILLRYNIVTFAIVLIIIGLCLAFYVFLSVTQSFAVTNNQENQEKVQELNDVKAAADEYRKNLATAKSIFDNSTKYTEVAIAITKLLPSGVVLDQLNITESNFGEPVQFAAHAKSFDHVLKLQSNFQQSELFSEPFIQNLSNGAGGGGEGSDSSGSTDSSGSNSAYPVSFTISARLNKVVGQW
jgi:Tfp pilus assembly protein PilN